MFKYFLSALITIFLISAVPFYTTPRNAQDKLSVSKLILTKDGLGSGVAISDKYILTNHHVVQDFKNVQYEGSDDIIHDAIVKYVNPNIDIVLLESKDPIENHANISCRAPEFGQEVSIVGRIEYMKWILTPAIVVSNEFADGLERYQDALKDILGKNFIILNAYVSFGASGSPVFYKDGTTVIGIVATLFNSKETNENMAKSGVVSMEDVCPWLDENKIEYNQDIWLNEPFYTHVDFKAIPGYINELKDNYREWIYEVFYRASNW